MISLMVGLLLLPPDDAWTELVHRSIQLQSQGQYREAEHAARKALDEAETFGAADIRLPRSLNNLAATYYKQGRYAEAESLYRRAIDRWNQIAGREVVIKGLERRKKSSHVLIPLERGRFMKLLFTFRHRQRPVEQITDVS